MPVDRHSHQHTENLYSLQTQEAHCMSVLVTMAPVLIRALDWANFFGLSQGLTFELTSGNSMDFTKGDLAKTKLRLIYQITTMVSCFMWSFISTQNILLESSDIYPLWDICCFAMVNLLTGQILLETTFGRCSISLYFISSNFNFWNEEKCMVVIFKSLLTKES